MIMTFYEGTIFNECPATGLWHQPLFKFSFFFFITGSLLIIVNVCLFLLIIEKYFKNENLRTSVTKYGQRFMYKFHSKNLLLVNVQ